MLQSDFEKVNRIVILPMNRHWPAAMDSETQEDFVKHLAKYPDRELKNAMESLVATSKSRPKIPHIIEKIAEARPARQPSGIPKHKGFHCSGHAEVMHQNSAREIMESRAGQFALKLGVGRALLNEYECSGKKDFTEADVHVYAKHVQENIQALRECEQKKNPEYKHWLGIFTMMQEREKRIYSQYYKN